MASAPTPPAPPPCTCTAHSTNSHTETCPAAGRRAGCSFCTAGTAPQHLHDLHQLLPYRCNSEPRCHVPPQPPRLAASLPTPPAPPPPPRTHDVQQHVGQISPLSHCYAPRRGQEGRLLLLRRRHRLPHCRGALRGGPGAGQPPHHAAHKQGTVLLGSHMRAGGSRQNSLGCAYVVPWFRWCWYRTGSWRRFLLYLERFGWPGCDLSLAVHDVCGNDVPYRPPQHPHASPQLPRAFILTWLVAL